MPVCTVRIRTGAGDYLKVRKKTPRQSPGSRVWPQAQNRMHAARGLMSFLLDVN